MRTFSMGRWIDQLDDDGRDRVLLASYNDGMVWRDRGCGCLIGSQAGPVVRNGTFVGLTVFDPFEHMDADEKDQLFASCAAERETASLEGRDSDIRKIPWAEATAAVRYPKAVQRFGKERVVRAIKLRAGARVTLPQPENVW